MSKSRAMWWARGLVIEGGNNLKEPAYGADVLRLWVATVDYSSDVRIGPNAIKQVFERPEVAQYSEVHGRNVADVRKR